MALRVILRVLKDKHLLNKANFPQILIIILVGVLKLVLYGHTELIDLETKGLSNFHTEVPDGLKVTDLHCLLDHIGTIDDRDIAWQKVVELRLFKFWLQSFFALIAVKELGKKLYSVADEGVII